MSIMFSEEELPTYNLKMILINEVDGFTKELSFVVPFHPGTSELRLNEAFDDTCQRIVSLNGCKLFQTDYVNKMNRYLGVYPIETPILISCDTVIDNSIEITYQPQIQSYGAVLEPASHYCEQTMGKERKVKERSIEEALNAVQKWRVLYDTPDEKGKRLYTLDEAAKIVGIAKKTLDDYYSLIRTAMGFNFNIENFKEQKIGILRKFVKIAKEEGEQGIQTKMSQYVYESDISKYVEL